MPFVAISLGLPVSGGFAGASWAIDLGAGLVGGLFSSMPIGPINLIVLELAWRSTDGRTGAFLFGVVSADVLVTALSLGSLTYLQPSRSVAILLGLVCAAILFALGTSGLLKSSAAAGTGSRLRSKASLAALGFTLCFINPLFPAFWFAFIAAYQELFGIGGLGAVQFLAGLVIGDILWFATLSHTARRVLKNKSERFVVRLRLGSSIIILHNGRTSTFHCLTKSERKTWTNTSASDCPIGMTFEFNCWRPAQEKLQGIGAFVVSILHSGLYVRNFSPRSAGSSGGSPEKATPENYAKAAGQVCICSFSSRRFETNAHLTSSRHLQI